MLSLENIRTCQHCHTPYDWRRSTSSSLKMTYCGTLCEKYDLGFTIESLLETERDPVALVMRKASERLAFEWMAA